MSSCVRTGTRYILLSILCVAIVAKASSASISYDTIFTGKQSSDEAAWSYVFAHTNLLKSAQNGSIELVEKKRSLDATHYYFQQTRNGIPVEDAQMIVSVRDADKAITKVFDTSFKSFNMMNLEDKPRISLEAAYDIAWSDLRVSGLLMDNPSSKMVYLSSPGRLDLVYKVYLPVVSPFGYWQYTINATSGKIMKKEDMAISRIAKDGRHTSSISRGGPLLNRKQTFTDYFTHLFQKVILDAPVEEEPTARADGTGLVFDPDPRTTLMDNTLQNDSPAERFDPAYQTRTLKDLTVVGGKYTLKGPWIKIEDFEPPSTKPTTTSNGKWEFKRGNNGFNDAMTYFQIDQTQRYIQSLGFVGEKGIQQGPIAVDTDGVDGADNSHFIPGSNRIAYGHGCVPDNEDADVILHEYGHAIHDSINKSWHGGDTGAMGEGFGDYWATSYHLSTPNGASFHADRVFHWDAGGEGNKCWPGRSVNAEGAMYDKSRTYQAHQRVGDFQSDELWSTPLVQSLRELMAQGYPRAHVDQIVLEAQFGLGANLRMPDMARSVVNAAQKLYPQEAYAAVFQKYFVQHNILEVPHAVLEVQSIELKEAGSNNVLDPGETVQLFVTLRNTGLLAANGIKVRVSSANTRAALSNMDPKFMDIAPGASVMNTIPIMLTLGADALCGEVVDVTLDLSFEGGSATSVKLNLQIPTGVANVGGGNVALSPALEIPDNDPKGIESTILINSTETITEKSEISVPVEIIHPFIGDLRVTLVSPSGKEVILHNRKNQSNHNIVGTYPTTLTPQDNLSKLVGEPLGGEWKLKVADLSVYDKGELKGWGFKAVIGHQCEQH